MTIRELEGELHKIADKDRDIIIKIRNKDYEDIGKCEWFSIFDAFNDYNPVEIIIEKSNIEEYKQS